MTPIQEVELFARVHANNPGLKDWLEGQHGKAVKFLVHSPDATAMRRAQGKADFIEKMIELLVSAHKLSR